MIAIKRDHRRFWDNHLTVHFRDPRRLNSSGLHICDYANCQLHQRNRNEEMGMRNVILFLFIPHATFQSAQRDETPVQLSFKMHIKRQLNHVYD